MSQKIIFSSASDMPPTAISQGGMAFNKTGSWRYLRPIYVEKLAPCRQTCPAGTDLPRVLRLITEKKFLEAYQLIRKHNPLPAVTGRVCYHPCETHCSRAPIDGCIPVQALERFVSEKGLEEASVAPVPESQSGRIAIIGSGPAGLTCAYFLVQEGFHVTILEAEKELGGMLRLGIPPYRLPRVILDREIESIIALGVKVRTNCRVGKDISFESLRDEYDAIFVASGAHRSRSIHLDGAISGLSFLRSVNSGGLKEIGERVIVIGGGNTAIDAARVALRLGAKPVVVYRRSRQEMPATDEEIEAAEEEGVDFRYLAAPDSIKKKNGRMEIQFQGMKLGDPDESGRRRPVPIPDSGFVLEADTMIEAIGEQPDLSFLSASQEDLHVVIGGDARSGSSTVVNAIASGKQAAASIMQYLQTTGDALSVSPLELSQLITPADVKLGYFTAQERAVIPKKSAEGRVNNFQEVVGTFSESQAVREAGRCISCGVCNNCDSCWQFCPEAAITRVDGGYEIDLDFCKGCGICAQECPRGVVSLVEEGL
jgi:NADPH-dependent glutamate synthase beta subunit-like oxidoreductase